MESGEYFAIRAWNSTISYLVFSSDNGRNLKSLSSNSYLLVSKHVVYHFVNRMPSLLFITENT